LKSATNLVKKNSSGKGFISIGALNEQLFDKKCHPLHTYVRTGTGKRINQRNNTL